MGARIKILFAPFFRIVQVAVYIQVTVSASALTFFRFIGTRSRVRDGAAQKGEYI